jgi:acyl-CoA synthetase (AMP-forming)/AMP-acid ligase II
MLTSLQATAIKERKILALALRMTKRKTFVGVGGALPEQRLVIVNTATSMPCAPDEIGEVWISGPGIALGYWNRAEETQETFRP